MTSLKLNGEHLRH